MVAAAVEAEEVAVEVKDGGSRGWQAADLGGEVGEEVAGAPAEDMLAAVGVALPEAACLLLAPRPPRRVRGAAAQHQLVKAPLSERAARAEDVGVGSGLVVVGTGRPAGSGRHYQEGELSGGLGLPFL